MNSSSVFYQKHLKISHNAMINFNEKITYFAREHIAFYHFSQSGATGATFDK